MRESQWWLLNSPHKMPAVQSFNSWGLVVTLNKLLNSQVISRSVPIFSYIMIESYVPDQFAHFICYSFNFELYLSKNIFWFLSVTSILLLVNIFFLVWFLGNQTTIQPISILEYYLTHCGQLTPYDTIWHHRTCSTSAHIMACCLTASNQYLDQCWLISEFL